MNDTSPLSILNFGDDAEENRNAHQKNAANVREIAMNVNGKFLILAHFSPDMAGGIVES